MSKRLFCGCFVGLWLVACAGCATPQQGASPNTEKTVVSPADFESKVTALGGHADFVFGDQRPFAQCHASTLVEAADGTLLCAWFAGTEEKNPDVGIWLSRRTEGGWTAPERVAKISETAHWNPVLFRDAAGITYLFFKVGLDVPRWSTWWMKSEDSGKTWSKPVELVPGDVGGRGPVKNKAILLSDGAWLAPASTETKPPKEAWLPFADRSEDGGKTWTRSANWAVDKAELKGVGAIQPTFWEAPAGQVHALMRSGGGWVWRADSADGGKTWGAVKATNLPNNNSGIDLVQLEDGRLVLLYNPVGKNWGPRTPLDLAVSADGGLTWNTVAHLEDDPKLKSEFSYPSIVRTKKGIALCYTWQRQRVRCWEFPLEALK